MSARTICKCSGHCPCPVTCGACTEDCHERKFDAEAATDADRVAALEAELEETQAAVRVERQRTDAAQAEVARRGDVMLAALREIERGEYNAAAMLLANVVRPPLPSPAQVTHYKPGPAPERRPAEVMHTTIGGRGVVGRLKP